MSWIVETIIKNKTSTLSKSDINSDEFMDLMAVESKIKYLKDALILSDYDVKVIDYFSDGNIFTTSKRDFGVLRNTLSNDFVKICNKIAFYLGGYYTDNGYVEYIRNKYKLNEEDTNKMVAYMKSKYKHKIMRKRKK